MARAKFERDVALMLDGEVRDAAPGIQPVGSREGVRRADIEALAAGAAMVGLGLVGREVEGREQLAEEEPGAVAAGDEVGGACPASRCPRGPRAAFPSPAPCPRTALPLRRRCPRRSARGRRSLALEHVVVVAALGIGRDDTPRWCVEQVQRIMRRAVVQAYHHDAACVGPERTGGRAPPCRCESSHAMSPA